MMRKTYLGDGVYVDYIVHMLILTTENGDGASNTIYMEPGVFAALAGYVKELAAELAAKREPKNKAVDLCFHD